MADTHNRAFKVRLQAATLEKVIDLRQAHGLPAGDVVGLWAQFLALAETIERDDARKAGTRP